MSQSMDTHNDEELFADIVENGYTIHNMKTSQLRHRVFNLLTKITEETSTNNTPDKQFSERVIQARAVLSEFYLSGFGVVSYDINKARALVAPTVKYENPLSLAYMARIESLNNIDRTITDKLFTEYYHAIKKNNIFDTINDAGAVHQYLMGHCYVKGYGVAKSTSKSEDLLTKSANKGNILASCVLIRLADPANSQKSYDIIKPFFQLQHFAVTTNFSAFLLLESNVEIQNIPLGIAILEDCASQGYINAIFYLTQYFLSGKKLYTPEKFTTITEFPVSVAPLSSPSASLQQIAPSTTVKTKKLLGRLIEISQDLERLEQFLKIGIKSGDPQYSLILSRIYMGLPAALNDSTTASKKLYNPTLAVEILKQAGEKGDNEALSELGNYYLMGVPGAIQKDYKLALTYFTKVMDNGSNHAAFGLASMYANGLGVAKDVNKGFKIAYENRNRDYNCCMLVTLIYIETISADFLTEAMECAILAIESGIEGVKGYLAIMFAMISVEYMGLAFALAVEAEKAGFNVPRHVLLVRKGDVKSWASEANLLIASGSLSAAKAIFAMLQNKGKLVPQIDLRIEIQKLLNARENGQLPEEGQSQSQQHRQIIKDIDDFAAEETTDDDDFDEYEEDDLLTEMESQMDKSKSSSKSSMRRNQNYHQDLIKTMAYRSSPIITWKRVGILVAISVIGLAGFAYFKPAKKN